MNKLYKLRNDNYNKLLEFLKPLCIDACEQNYKCK